MKLTVRPADGHEIKFGGVFQDYQYNIGQLNRGPTTTAAQLRVDPGLVGLCLRRQELHRHADLEIFAARTTCCSTGTPRSTATAPTTTRSRPTTTRTTGGGALRRRQSRQQHLRLRRRPARLSARYLRHRRQQHLALQCRRLAQRGDLRLRCVPGRGRRPSISRGNSNITTPGGERTVSGGFVQLKNNYSTWLEVVSALRYDHYDLNSPTHGVTTGGDRFSPKITVGVTPVAGFTPYVSYAEGYRAPSITETLIAGEPRHRRRSGACSLARTAPRRCSASCPTRICGRRSARTRKPAST